MTCCPDCGAEGWPWVRDSSGAVSVRVCSWCGKEYAEGAHPAAPVKRPTIAERCQDVRESDVVEASRKLLPTEGFRLILVQQRNARRAGSDPEVLDGLIADMRCPCRSVLPIEFKADERGRLTVGQHRCIVEWGVGVGPIWTAQAALDAALEWRRERGNG